MVVGTAAERRPVIFAVRLFDGQIIDAGNAHQPIVVFPILIAI